MNEIEKLKADHELTVNMLKEQHRMQAKMHSMACEEIVALKQELEEERIKCNNLRNALKVYMCQVA